MRIATVLAVALLGTTCLAGTKHAQAETRHYQLNISPQSVDEALKDHPKVGGRRKKSPVRIAKVATETSTVGSGASPHSAPISDTTLGEVVVTAQKRTQSLLRVPISMSVLSGAALDKSLGQGVLDELGKVPGAVVIPTGATLASTEIAIRGVASDSPLSGASPVAFYLDTVPFGFVTHAMVPDTSPFDLQRVEVLRGPQGTLYGANAEDGVVRVITNDADLNAFDLKARVFGSDTQYGNGNFGGDVAVNVPIVDGKLAVRGVVGYKDMSGWIDRQAQTDANDAQLRNYRLKVGYRPIDALSVGLEFWSSRDDFGAPSTSLPDRTAPASGTAPEPQSNDFDMYAATVGYDFSHVTLKSMTSYLDFSTDSTASLGPYGAGLENLILASSDTSRLWSEEFLLNSTDTGPWHYTAGFFYRDTTDTYVQGNPPPEKNIGAAGYAYSSRSYAIFGELSRRFMDNRLEWTLGVRQFHDDVSLVNIIPPSPATDQSFQATTPRVVLSWYPGKDVTVYSSFAEGFRSGAPQPYADLQLDPNLPAIKPDKLYNYELGAKADVFDHRLLVDTSVYYVKWKDVQQTIGIPLPGGVGGFGAVINGHDASGPGVDFAVTVRPTKRAQIGGTISWNDLTMDNDTFSFGQLLFPRGARLNNSSRYTGSLFATYAVLLGDNGTSGEFSVSSNYISRQSAHGVGPLGVYANVGDNVLFAQAAFTVSFPTNWSLMLFGDNLTNEYRSVQSPVAPGYAPSIVELTGRPRPRTVGLQVDYHFR